MAQNMCQWYHYPTLVLPSWPHVRLHWSPWVYDVYQNITDYLLQDNAFGLKIIFNCLHKVYHH